MVAKTETKRKKGPGRPPKSVVGKINDMPPTDDVLVMYKDMLLIRRFEEKAGQLYGMGQIGGFCHLYIGQEAVVVGLQSASEPGDTVVTSYRDHGHMLACGMAALWRLPCLFIIENNQYGMGTAVTRAAAGRALADRGLAYGIPGKQVDGMDVLAVRSAALEALAHCRDGHGPYILEMKTYRYRGHSMSDPAKYRTREEVDAMRKQHDPIDQMRVVLKNQNITDEKLKSIDSDVKVTVTKATEFAQTSPEPDVAELFTDILLPVDDSGQPTKV